MQFNLLLQKLYKNTINQKSDIYTNTVILLLKTRPTVLMKYLDVQFILYTDK